MMENLTMMKNLLMTTNLTPLVIHSAMYTLMVFDSF